MSSPHRSNGLGVAHPVTGPRMSLRPRDLRPSSSSQGLFWALAAIILLTSAIGVTASPRPHQREAVMVLFEEDAQPRHIERRSVRTDEDKRYPCDLRVHAYCVIHMLLFSPAQILSVGKPSAKIKVSSPELLQKDVPNLFLLIPFVIINILVVVLILPLLVDEAFQTCKFQAESPTLGHLRKRCKCGVNVLCVHNRRCPPPPIIQ